MLNNGDRYILTYVDLFSKYGAARTLKNKEVKSVIIAVDDILSKLASGTLPNVIQSDNGSEFDKTFEIISHRNGRSRRFIQLRFNRTIKSKILLHMTKFV